MKNKDRALSGATLSTPVAGNLSFWYSKGTMEQKNTLQKGSVRYIVFKAGDAWYAVGLEFNIVESGTSPQEAMLLLFEALQGYVESARKIKARPDILNQKTDAEYETMWRALETKKFTSTVPVFSFGQRSFVPA
jgi:predicted RNase H-like HicB family nuclease